VGALAWASATIAGISHGVHRSGALVAYIVFSIEDGAPGQRDLNDSKLLAAVRLILR